MRWLFKQVHFSWATIAWAIGVIVGDVVFLIVRKGWFANGWWLAVSILGLLLTIICPRRIVILGAAVAGIILIGWRNGVDLVKTEYLVGLIGNEICISGVIIEDPDTSEGKTSYRLGNLRLNGMATGNEPELPGTVYVSGMKEQMIQRSDRVNVKGKLSPGFGTFVATMYRPKITDIVRPEPGDLFLKLRNFMAEKVAKYVPEPELSLGLGYLLGVKSSLPEGLADTLKVVGLTHIIVASGSNLSILAGFSRKLFGKVSRFGGLFLSLLLVLGYVGMVGLSPSMVRAAIVSILSLAAWYVGREMSPLRLLLVVAAVTILFNPIYAMDLGWLLSFGSFSGIMLMGPILQSFFYGEREPGLLGGTLLETVSASIVCVPIILYFFGTMSLISLIANLLVLPTISMAMTLVFMTGTTGLLVNGLTTAFEWVATLFWWLPEVFGWMTTKLLSFHLTVINFLGEQKQFIVEIPKEQWVVFLMYVPMIIIGVIATRRRTKKTQFVNNCCNL